MIDQVSQKLTDVKALIEKLKECKIPSETSTYEKSKKSRQFSESLREIAQYFTDVLVKYRKFDELVLYSMRSSQMDETDGVINASMSDLEASQLQRQSSVENMDIHAQAEIDQVQQLVNARTEDINRIHRLMFEVNKIAKDINLELKAQEKKVQKVENDVEDAESNVSDGLKELNTLHKSKKQSMKTLAIIFTLLVILFMFFYIVIRNAF